MTDPKTHLLFVANGAFGLGCQNNDHIHHLDQSLYTAGGIIKKQMTDLLQLKVKPQMPGGYAIVTMPAFSIRFQNMVMEKLSFCMDMAAVRQKTSYCEGFANCVNRDSGDAKVVYLPDEGIYGNSHFMFQKKTTVKFMNT